VLLAGAIPLDSPDELEEQWSGGAGMTAILSTPIYPGYLDAGVLLTMNKARDELTPDFLIRYLFLGWDWYVSLPGSFQGFAGVHCGNCNFLFDDTDVTDPQKSESEFAAGFSTGGKYSFSENWLLACNLRQTTVFTRRRIHLTHLIVGVEYRFDNPDWLRGLLR
jgi:hypothetical protein